ncbi:Filament-like plant protein [Dillenia turbinata]|uniref:Filament-like plant protein n=1 Tax=Dillenia turbinata TaxID=194707 RepID=A0AAN8UVV9_9MAGN
MDHKTWLWKKKSSEKTIIASDKVVASSGGNLEEMLSTEKEEELERSVKYLKERLAFLQGECKTKDDLVVKHAKIAQEAIAGREKAEAKAKHLTEELDEASKDRVSATERLAQQDAALKDCMQQLTSVRSEQEQRIRDSVAKISMEFEQVQKKLDEKLMETSQRLSKVMADNSHLNKVLLVKEVTIEDLCKRNSQAEAEFNVLIDRLDKTEKENSFLKYEFRMLEKELELRNEERDYACKSACASHRQIVDNAKKISKLEAECQRLRALVRRRLPGPPSLGKIRNEIEVYGRDSTDMRRKKLDLTSGSLIVRDTAVDNSEIPSRRINILIERLCGLEEENKMLKDTLTKKNNELNSSRVMSARMASKLTKVEAQLGELSKSQKRLEPESSPRSSDISIMPAFDVGDQTESRCSESWASALISELEHFKNAETKNSPELKSITVSDMSLMDDFVEMEKLAIVAVDTPSLDSDVTSSGGRALACIPAKESSEHRSDASGKELVPVDQDHSEFNGTNKSIQSDSGSAGKSSWWIQDVVNIVLEQHCVTGRSTDDLLEEVKIVLASMKYAGSNEKDLPEISSYITWKSPNASPRVDSLDPSSGFAIVVDKAGGEHVQSGFSKSIAKIVELVKGIDPRIFVDDANPDVGSRRDQLDKTAVTPAGFWVRAFQWKSSKLTAVLRQFVDACNDILNGKADFDKFAEELTNALQWTLNNCIPFQDDSFTDDGREVEVKKIWSDLEQENRVLKDELKNMEYVKKELEATLKSAIEIGETLKVQLSESRKGIENLQAEVDNLRESKGMTEEQIENQKSINEDLDTQLTVARAKLNETLQKFSALEVEFEDKSNCCEDLESTCLELQLQLESVVKKEVPRHYADEEEKRGQTVWEVTAASMKLAECQETILNLGKQLKALASPREVALLDKVFTTNSEATTNPSISNDKTPSCRSSLLDRMLAEDNCDAEAFKSTMIKEVITSVNTEKPMLLLTYGSENSRSHQVGAIGPLALVPVKKRGGGGFLRRLLRKRGSNKNKKRTLTPLLST